MFKRKEKEKKRKENYYVYGTDSRNFSKKYISISYTDGADYFYYEVLCFDQDISEFISNKIFILKDGIPLNCTYEYKLE